MILLMMKIKQRMKHTQLDQFKLMLFTLFFACSSSVLAQVDPDEGLPKAQASFNAVTDVNCDAPPNVCFDIQMQAIDTPMLEFYAMNGRMFFDNSVLKDPILIPTLQFYTYTIVLTPEGPSPQPTTPGLSTDLGMAEAYYYQFNITTGVAFPVLTADIVDAQPTTVGQVCFTVVGPIASISEVCPALIWDLEQDGAGGLQGGNTGVTLSHLVPDPNAPPGTSYILAPLDEQVDQYNWEYSGNVSGAPVVQEGCTQLPCDALNVELSSFNVMRSGARQAKLYWTTESETNNDFFLVQRSIDGTSFEDIGEVKGHGTTSKRQTYEFFDNEPKDGKNYYRLIQYDFDGSSALSGIRSVVFEGGERTQLSIVAQPNPFINTVQVTYETDQISSLSVYSAEGSLIEEMKFTGDVNQKLDLSGMPIGVYVIKVRLANDEEVISKIVKAQ